jgi:hypothetical protein
VIHCEQRRRADEGAKREVKSENQTRLAGSSGAQLTCPLVACDETQPIERLDMSARLVSSCARNPFDGSRSDDNKQAVIAPPQASQLSRVSQRRRAREEVPLMAHSRLCASLKGFGFFPSSPQQAPAESGPVARASLAPH